MNNFLLSLKEYRGIVLCILSVVLSISTPVELLAQATAVQGRIVSETGEGIPGVTVLEMGTNNGTTTDLDGNYKLNVSAGAILNVSFIGYSTQQIPVGNRSVIDVNLELDVKQLEEVVVVGYGTQRKSTVTGSISKVQNDDLDQIAVPRVDDALVGQVSGVNIQATNAEAGEAPTITIRGFGSVTADSGPAVVVDGVVVNSDFLGNMNMNDIESFEILKDAASAAIYGSEGANGVILITTKSGRAGKTSFSYDAFIGFKEAFGSDEYKKSLADWAEIERAETGELSDATRHAFLISEAAGGVDRDWQDVFFDGGIIQSHALSARGGNEQTTFSTSLKFVEDEGVVITDNFKLFTGSMKVDTKLNDKLKFGVSATPSYTKKRRLPTSVHNAIRQSPWLPIYHTEATLALVDQTDPDDPYSSLIPGDYAREDHFGPLDLDGDGDLDGVARTSGDNNPYSQFVEREHYDITTAILGSTYLSYEIIDGLTAKTRVGVTLDQRKRTRWDGSDHHHSDPALYEAQDRYRTRVISDNFLTYNKEFGNHEIGATALVTIQERTSQHNAVTGTGFSNDRIKNLAGATDVTEPEEINWVHRKIGYLARINYAFNDKYLFNASYRRDGSSVFGVDSKWGSFPAVSVGWNAHNEAFLADNKFLSLLKLRASYGRTGAENFNVGDDIVNKWPYLSLLNQANAVVEGQVVSGVTPLNVANSLLQWEASAEMTVGVDYGVLGNRITGSIDYYERVSDNLLLNNPVSYGTGFNNAIVNLGEVKNSGMEFELRSKNLVGDISWNTTFIASTNKNELTAFGDSDGALLEDTFGRNSQWINSVGNPISSFYGYVVDRSVEVPTEFVDTPWNRINGGAEDAVVVDLNGDGIITDADKTILGDPYPDFIWSVTNDFKYKNFDFSFMIQGSYGAQVKNIGDQYFYTWWSGATDPGPQALVDAGIVPHASFLQEKVLTDQVVQDASYVSVRNVNLGYRLPTGFVSKLGLVGVRFYVSGQNLFYFTSDEYNGFNPEYIDDDDNPRRYGSQRAGSPLFRTMTFGVNVEF